jgi:hypothetical protein
MRNGVACVISSSSGPVVRVCTRLCTPQPAPAMRVSRHAGLAPSGPDADDRSPT